MRFRYLWLVLLLAVSPAWAQDTNVTVEDTSTPSRDAAGVVDQDTAFVDQAEWAAVAERANAALISGLASNTAFGDLRSELADWRDKFLARQTLNASRITTVRAQITALGEVAETGEENARIAARRALLTDQLSDLRAPVTLALEAYTQANGQIGEIDSIIRDRQTELFLERSQSPLNPNGWSQTWDAVTAAVATLKGEVQVNANNPRLRSEMLSQLPAIFVLLAVSVVFVLRGRAWFSWVTGLILSHSRRGQNVVQFVLSLGQIVIPLLGLLAFATALQLTGMPGRRLSAIIEVLPHYGLLAILAHWFAEQLLPKNAIDNEHLMGLSPEQSTRAHRRFILLGYTMMAFGLAQVFVRVNTLDVVPSVVVLLPFGVVMAWALYWFGHIMRRTTIVESEDVQRSFRVTLRSAISRGLMAAAVLGIGLAVLGYSSALDSITYPAAMTVFVLALLLLLQRLSVDAYTLLSKLEGSAQDALMPVLIGFMLVLVSLPVLAVIWGAQVTDLTELWARFREGFNIGETKISPSNFLLFAVVFVLGYTITRLIQGALRTTILPRTKLDIGGQNAVVSGLGYVGIFLAALIAITTAGIDLSGLAIVAGALSVGIGFGLQNIVSNFISGIILLIERPISQGDWIEVGGQMGYVRDISVRSTRIETFDRTDVIVPNADLISNQVINWTRGNSVGRAIVPVGVAYGTDTDWVTSILREIAEAHPMVVLNPPPAVMFVGFGADSLDFQIRAILRDVNYVMNVKSDMNHAIAKRFVAEGIEIPFGQRDIWLRNPEALDFGGKRPAQTPTVETPKAAPPKDDVAS
jgi:small-conductance mechanosensitive channel